MRMRNINFTFTLLLAVLSIALAGCNTKGYSLAPVSGTVTYDGKPVEKLRVSFSPEPVGDNLAVGPYSKGVTDGEGKFTLVTRYDEKGAVIGKHRLNLEYSDVNETAMADLHAALADAKDGGSKADVKETQKKIESLKAKLKGRPLLKKCNTLVDIPADGHENLVLDLGELFK